MRQVVPTTRPTTSRAATRLWMQLASIERTPPSTSLQTGSRPFHLASLGRCMDGWPVGDDTAVQSRHTPPTYLTRGYHDGLSFAVQEPFPPPPLMHVERCNLPHRYLRYSLVRLNAARASESAQAALPPASLPSGDNSAAPRACLAVASSGAERERYRWPPRYRKGRMPMDTAAVPVSRNRWMVADLRRSFAFEIRC